MLEMPSIAIIVPVGPGHEIYDQPKEAITVDDTQGQLGRGRARNIGIDRAPDADWYLFLDADDDLSPSFWDVALRDVSLHREAGLIQGTIAGWTRGGQQTVFPNVYPATWNALVSLDSTNGLFSTGALIRGDVARKFRWHEELVTTEVIELYMAICAEYPWVKTNSIYSRAHTDRPSAHGPKGYRGMIPWHRLQKPVLEWWRDRGRVPITNERRAQADYWTR